MKSKNLSKTIKVSLLSAFALILMFFEFALPIFPDFLKIDLSDVPALIGAFALGPMAGIMIEFVKNLIHFAVKNQTAGIGEAANFLVGVSFVLPAALIYRKNKTKTGAIYAVICGIISMGVTASLLNYYIFLPLYEKVLHFPIDAIVGIAAKVNPAIKDINTLIVYSILPFNLVKGLIASAVTILIYKRVSPILHK
ncbi:ECF transporter S component [Caloramator mitchellensis]|uniref:ECF transporter S component n=1 Tax=Caloramator mitchellensis TaxID=908809 RepID=UPI000716F7BA|nr:ECF transporter S component [Caloramator mitchellensis]